MMPERIEMLPYCETVLCCSFHHSHACLPADINLFSHVHVNSYPKWDSAVSFVKCFFLWSKYTKDNA